MSLPTRPAGQRLLLRWFVEYNPTFIASALSVLGGVLLMSKVRSGDHADVLLTATLEVYQWLVIGVAAFLFRRDGERRPAVMLGLIETVFLIDPTLQTSALAAAQETIAGWVWVACFGLKWHALERAFSLRLSWSARAVPIAAAAVVAQVPVARLAFDAEALTTAVALAVLVLGAIAPLSPFRITPKGVPAERDEEMRGRLLRAVAGIMLAGVGFQVGIVVSGLGLMRLAEVVGATLVVGAAAVRREWLLWALLAAAAFVFRASALGPPTALAFLSVGLLLASRRHAPRVLVTGVVGSFLAVPAAGLVVAGLATVALVYALVARRGWSALPGLVVVHWSTLTAVAPRAPSQWGLVLVVAGFALLPASLVLRRHLRRALLAAG